MNRKCNTDGIASNLFQQYMYEYDVCILCFHSLNVVDRDSIIKFEKTNVSPQNEKM